LALKSIQPARRRLADQVYDQIINAIVNRDIVAEDRLIQEKLAAELQISRTPVREALMRLEQEGVLEVTNRGSFKIYEMGDKEVRELYQSRAAIEGQCARILASKNNPLDIEALRQTIIKEEDLKVHTARAYFEANRNIHFKFVELADNRFLIQMFNMIWGKANVFPIFAAIENVDLKQSLGDHMELVDVIETGDKTETLEVFTKHIEEGFDLQLQGLHKSK
jgi:DNA-binding GntR family transcriptional regulator|tara:strand:- start:100 stop:765 length:666 start_codon:yes stop_codon:yes gene_type:complete